MITIVSGTNRKNSNSSRLANVYAQILSEKGIEHQVFKLEDLSPDVTVAELYGERTPEFASILDQYFTQVPKWVFIFPEYNGGFPGILKVMIDAMEPQIFKGKKVAITGLSAGRAGNLRGLDQMTNVLHYLQAEVLSDKPKLSQFHTLMGENGELTDEGTHKRIAAQLEKLINF